MFLFILLAFNVTFIPPGNISTLGGDKLTKVIGEIEFNQLDNRLSYHTPNQKYAVSISYIQGVRKMVFRKSIGTKTGN